MIFTVSGKGNKKYDLFTRVRTVRGVWKEGTGTGVGGDGVGTRTIIFPEGEYHLGGVPVEGMMPFLFVRDSLVGRVGEETIEIYANVYCLDEELIYVNDILRAIRVRDRFDVANIGLALRDPRRYVTMDLINSKKVMSKKTILTEVVPTNTVISLTSIDELDEAADSDGASAWFATTKMDGETAVVSCLTLFSEIIVYSMKNKRIEDPVYTMKYEKMETWFEDRVFMGELVRPGPGLEEQADGEADTLYLFLECNDTYGDFHIDIEHMKGLVAHYSEAPPIEQVPKSKKSLKILMNNILIDKPWRELAKEIDARFGDVRRDGIVFGRVKTKYHLKWKPAGLNTIDFYIELARGKMYMYVWADAKVGEKMKRPGQGQGRVLPIPGYPDKVYVLNGVQDGVDFVKNVRFHRQVVECRQVDGQWEMYRIRPDKKGIPNHMSVARNMLQGIKNPISFEDLIK